MGLVFDSGPHTYELDGVRVPSVTQILHGAGLIQLDHVPPFILEQARTRGSAVHQLVHYYNEGDLDWDSVDERYRPYLEAWVRFCDQRVPVMHLAEHRIASRRHRVAGTVDLFCAMDGEGWLLDFATGDPADVAKDLQTAAYLGLAHEWARSDDPALLYVLSATPRWRRGAVRLQASGAARLVEYSHASDFTHFQTLAAAHHIRAARGVRLPVEEIAA